MVQITCAQTMHGNFFHKALNVPGWKYNYKWYSTKGFYISKSVYTSKQVSRTGLLNGLKISPIDQTKKVPFVASLVPAYAGKLTTYDCKAEESLNSFWNLVNWLAFAARFWCKPMTHISWSFGPLFSLSEYNVLCLSNCYGLFTVCPSEKLITVFNTRLF